MKKDDLYIAILKYGKANLGKPINLCELMEHLTSKGYVFDNFSVEQFFSALFIDSNLPRGNVPGSLNKEGKYFLEHEGYFHLLEHEELESARKSSFGATIFAGVAIIISIISALFSIYYSQLQIDSPITIESAQLDKMDNVKLQSSIDTLIDVSKNNAQSINDINEKIDAIQAHNTYEPISRQ